MVYDYPPDYLYIGSEIPFIGSVTLAPPPNTTLSIPPSTTSVDFTPGAGDVYSVLPEGTTQWVTITTDRTTPLEDGYEAEESPELVKLPVPTTSIRKRKLMLD